MADVRRGLRFVMSWHLLSVSLFGLAFGRVLVLSIFRPVIRLTAKVRIWRVRRLVV